MLGGEHTSLSRSAGATSRTLFHPATIHWKTPTGTIGWVWLRDTPRIDATASKNTLTITAIGDSIFRLSAPGLSAAALTRDRWTLPGLIVDVTTDANVFTITPGATGSIEASVHAATPFWTNCCRGVVPVAEVCNDSRRSTVPLKSSPSGCGRPYYFIHFCL